MSKPIFIAGCPRSGTSILAFLVGRHSNVLAYLEPRGIYELFNELVLRRSVPQWIFRSLFALWVPRRLAYAVSTQQPALAVNLREYVSGRAIYADLKRLAASGDINSKISDFRQFLERMLGGYAMRCGRSRWCVKQPTYLYPNIDLVHRIHPDMKFVHIVRDGRDTVASILRQHWAQRRIDRFSHAMRLWLTLETGDRKASMLRPENFHRVRLEDLIADEEEARRLCQFLEEDYDAPMAEYYRSRIRSGEGMVGRWKRDLTKEQVEHIERVGGSILRRHGYI